MAHQVPNPIHRVTHRISPKAPCLPLWHETTRWASVYRRRGAIGPPARTVFASILTRWPVFGSAARKNASRVVRPTETTRVPGVAPSAKVDGIPRQVAQDRRSRKICQPTISKKNVVTVAGSRRTVDRAPSRGRNGPSLRAWPRTSTGFNALGCDRARDNRDRSRLMTVARKGSRSQKPESTAQVVFFAGAHGMSGLGLEGMARKAGR